MPTIKCVQVSPDYFVGATTLADIRGNCLDPRRVDRATEAEKAKDPTLFQAATQRGNNQRSFDKARTLRAVDYAKYINAVEAGDRMGGCPPITLWTAQTAIFDGSHLAISGGTLLTANDGETQLAARYMLANGFSGGRGFKEYDSVTGDIAWLDRPFAVTISTGSTVEKAMQVLHDMNHYATPVSEKNTMALNVEGALTKAINAGIVTSGVQPGAIKMRGVHRAKEAYYTSLIALMHGAIGAAYGPEAFTRSVNARINEANSQKSTAIDSREVVSKFIAKVLTLERDLRRIDCEHMMALGVHFAKKGRLAKPLDEVAYAKLDKTIREESNGKRNTITRRASRIEDLLK